MESEYAKGKRAFFWIRVALVLMIIGVITEVVTIVSVAGNLLEVWDNSYWKPSGIASLGSVCMSLWARKISYDEQPASWNEGGSDE